MEKTLGIPLFYREEVTLKEMKMIKNNKKFSFYKKILLTFRP